MTPHLLQFLKDYISMLSFKTEKVRTGDKEMTGMGRGGDEPVVDGMGWMRREGDGRREVGEYSPIEFPSSQPELQRLHYHGKFHTLSGLLTYHR